MSLIHDIALFRQLASGTNLFKDDGTRLFDKPYVFSNEYLYEYLSQVDLLGKKVLTTGSSGDQILYSIGFGAKEVTCYDINPFDKYIFDYKAACIKTFDWYTLRRMIIKGSKDTILTEHLFNKEMYNRIQDNIGPISKRFWAEAFKSCPAEYISGLFQSHAHEIYKYKYINDIQTYNQLRQVLLNGDYKVKFITTDVRDIFSKLNADDKFDFIMLSNIINYCCFWGDKPKEEKIDYRAKGMLRHRSVCNCLDDAGIAQFKALIDKLSNLHLANGGIVQVGYWYAKSALPKKWLSTMFDTSKLTEINLPDDNGVMMYAPKPYLSCSDTKAIIPYEPQIEPGAEL